LLYLHVFNRKIKALSVKIPTTYLPAMVYSLSKKCGVHHANRPHTKGE
jgi:hypothetical protein